MSIWSLFWGFMGGRAAGRGVIHSLSDPAICPATETHRFGYMLSDILKMKSKDDLQSIESLRDFNVILPIEEA